MKILKIETVSHCAYCPSNVDFFDPKSKTKIDKNKCSKTKRIIKDIWGFPSWCPLEDYKEADHENPN